MGLPTPGRIEYGIVMATVPATCRGRRRPSPSSPTSTRRRRRAARTSSRSRSANYDGGDIVLPGDPRKVIRVARQPGAERRSSARRSSRPTAPRCSGPTTRAASPSSWRSAELLTREPGDPARADPRLLHLRRGDRPRRRSPRPEEARGGRRLHARRQGPGEIDGETFSADLATVTITGVNIHPSIAKGRMVNAVRLAGLFLDRLPQRTLVAGDDGRPRGLPAPVPHRGRRGRDDDPLPAARLRHAEAGGARRTCCARSAGRSRREFPAAKVEGRREAAVPQHGRRDGEGAAGGAVRRRGDAAGRAGAEAARSSAAAPTARG